MTSGLLLLLPFALPMSDGGRSSDAPPQSALQGDEPALPSEPASAWSLRPGAWARHSFAADLDSVAGELGITRAGASFVATRRVDEARTLSLGVSHERTSYDFSAGESVFGAGNPLERPARSSVWSSWAQRESSKFAWSASVFASAGMEPSAELSDAMTYGGGATIDYRLTSNFAFQLGLYGTTRLEDSFFMYPISAIDWQVSEDIHVGSEGSGVGIGIALGDDVHSYGNIAFAVRQFRLDDDGFGPSQTFPGGVFRDDELAFNLGLVWTPDERLRVELFGGLALRELTLLDVDGSGFQVELDPAPFLGASVSFGL